MNRTICLVGAFVLFVLASQSHAVTNSKEYMYLEGVSVSSWFNKRLPIFSAPTGRQVGSFKLIVTDSWCLLEWKYKGKMVRTHEKDLYSADLCWNPIVYGEENGFYHVLVHSIDGGVWIKKENKLSSVPNEVAIFNPRSIISTIRNAPTFAFKYDQGLVVRSKPSPEAEIVTVLGRSHIIVGATGNIEGLWAEVEIFEVNGYPTEEIDGKIYPKSCASRGSWEPFKVNDLKGWIKVLNDNGLPSEFTWSTRC